MVPLATGPRGRPDASSGLARGPTVRRVPRPDWGRADDRLETAPRTIARGIGVAAEGPSPASRDVLPLVRLLRPVRRIEAVSFFPEPQRERGHLAGERHPRELLAHVASEHAVIEGL
jgi:hypothetical protein